MSLMQQTRKNYKPGDKLTDLHLLKKIKLIKLNNTNDKWMNKIEFQCLDEGDRRIKLKQRAQADRVYVLS